MERIIQNKRDIAEMLVNIRKDITQIRTGHFDSGIVTKTSWESSPSARISFRKSKIPMLKAAGIMKDPSEYEYGWHFPNAYYSKVNSELKEADKQLSEILSYLKDCHIRQKTYSYSEENLSLFSVIEGGGRDSWLASRLMGGANNG